MSELRTHSLRHNTATGEPNIEMYADGSTSIRNLQNLASNLITNGAMTVTQRATSNTGQTATAYRACDRFQTGIDSFGTWTVSQAASAPVGFSKSLRMECTANNTSPAAGAFVAIFHTIEAQNLQLLNYGTANAKDMQLRFWVRSNKTGSASFAIRQRDNSEKLFSKTYSFHGTANAWKKIEFEIPKDTAGVINDDTGQGLTLGWWLNSGSNFLGGSATTGWEAMNNNNRNPANAGIGSAVGDYFEITGVQLTATDAPIEFQHEDIATTLAKCQRYYVRFGGEGSGDRVGTGYVTSASEAICLLNFPVQMRIAPTSMDQSGTAGDYSVANTDVTNCNAVPVFSWSTKCNAGITLTMPSIPGNVRDSIMARFSSTDAFLGFSAEL